MNRIVGFARLRSLGKIRTQFSRNSHHDAHHAHNPGPPITLDYMPIPHQSYATVYGKLQRKWNTYLIGSFALLTGSTALALYCDTFSVSSWLAPESYRYRNSK